MHDELDILREVGSIASGHGSTALSEILKRQVSLSFPSVDIITTREMPSRINAGEIMFAVFCRMLTGLEGEVAVILNKENACRLINLSCEAGAKEMTNTSLVTEYSLSALKEIGNIIIASYVNSLSLMFKKAIIPPIPTLVSGSVDEALSVILSSHWDVDYCYFIEAVFEEVKGGLKGGFSLIITPYAARDIKEMCRKMINADNREYDDDLPR